MEEIFVEATDDSPSVLLSKQKNAFVFGSRSYPEDPLSFYNPILSWFQRYCKDPNEKTVIEFKLDYYNTATSKQIYKMLSSLYDLSTKKDVLIKWYYRKDDKDMLASGDIFSKLTNLKFEFVEF